MIRRQEGGGSKNPAVLRRHTNDSLCAVIDRLSEARSTMSKAKFKALQTNVGFNACEDGFLLDMHLRQVVKPAD